jgi:hypothetical protein
LGRGLFSLRRVGLVEARGSTQQGAPLELALPPLPDSGHQRQRERLVVR